MKKYEDFDEVKLVKGNIPIDKNVYQKYKNVEEIFKYVPKTYNYDGIVNINENIPELDNIDFNNLNISDAKYLAKFIFSTYHYNNEFYNNGKILVTGNGISESIIKIYQSIDQKKLIKEHLLIFSDLGDIIEHATLVNQTREIKGRLKYNSWNYYFNGIKIGNIYYDLEFDVVAMSNGKNNYRVQRLQLTSKQKNRCNHCGYQ